ncbi:class I SAM-dependent methyltransferase [Alteromonas sp. a30]|uniref:class I SAM-dependent methyltransferase n=1 Tax=Alteromonas sp. a30 TaxID=2730917 RepID=UPI0022810E38|nr:class I SAM-dependent methyltransferase [Alteromonas sp. a30]MCY7296246.1 class I SAM-dependent methyltransferase [Alteromonas sp. a30]
MSNSPSLPLLCTFGAGKDKAIKLAEKWGFELSKKITSGLFLELSVEHLALKSADEPKLSGVFVDFASDALSYRRKHGGGKQEFVAKAVGVKGDAQLSVLDATGGLGRDAFILASLGCSVTLMERSSVVAALLADGLERATLSDTVGSWLPERIQLIHGESQDLMQHWEGEAPDVVYLDPMFPHRKKSAQVKKEMRLFQSLLGGDLDADELLVPALELAKKRVVVKRPGSAEVLAGRKPDTTVNSKKHRFDIYFTNLG